jgi:hypothetical protein
MRALLAIVALVVLAPAGAAAAPLDPIEPTDPSPFVLRDEGTWAGNEAIVADLARGMPPATVAAVMRDANRETRALGNEVDRVNNVANGYRWAAGDDAVTTWYPQGITTSADATDDGKWGANRIQLVSWYGKGDRAGAGVRISFVLANKLSGARYRHVLLVEPYRHPDGTADFRAVKVHAGGIAWYGSYLYVADTNHGLRVFDVRRMLQTTSSAKGVVGSAGGGKYAAAGYKYVLPQVSRYVRPSGSDLVFSFVSVDRASSPQSLLTGEYRKGKAGGRLVRWPLDTPSDRLAGGADLHAGGAYVMPQTNVQGALSAAGRLFLSASAGAKGNGTLTSDVPGKPSRAYAWGYGAEDLTYSPLSGRIYSLTEHPGRRAVYAVPATAATAAPGARPAAATGYVTGPSHTKLLEPPRTLACSGHDLKIGVKVPRSAFPRGSCLSINAYLRGPHAPRDNSVALQKRTFFFRKPGADTWDLPAARCGHAYVVSYDVKVHGRRKGRRDFAVTVGPRGS